MRGNAVTRRVVGAWLIGPLALHRAAAQQRKPTDVALRVGVETVLVDSGYVDRMRRAFAGATGLNLMVRAGASTALLTALESGEVDAAITHAPALEAQLESQGLVHDQHAVARGDFLLVGPGAATAIVGPAGAKRDVAQALALLARAGAAFLSRGDGSGTHLAEQALWRAAAVAPQAPAYRSLQSAQPGLLAQAAAQGACTLVDRSTWALGAPAGLRVLLEGDPRMATVYRVQRPFRGGHPAAKLFVSWLAGPDGQALAAGSRGLRAVA